MLRSSSRVINVKTFQYGDVTSKFMMKLIDSVVKIAFAEQCFVFLVSINIVVQLLTAGVNDSSDQAIHAIGW